MLNINIIIMSRFDILDDDYKNTNNISSIDEEIDNKYFKTHKINKKKNTKQKFTKEKIQDEDDFLDQSLTDIYKIYFFHNNYDNWNDIDNFENVFNIEKWIDIPQVFNSFINKKDKLFNYNLFIMKNKISPLWESQENRYAGRINIQIYDLKETLEVLKKLLVNIINKSFLKPQNMNKTSINGLALLPKMDKMNVSYQIIQIWFSNNIIKNISNKAEHILDNNIFDEIKKYSIRTKIHKPQY